MPTNLSVHAYNSHNREVQKAYILIQSTKVKDGTIICTSINDLISKQTIIKWNKNAHCPCLCSHDVDFQCEHERKHEVVSLLINLEVNGFKIMSTIRCILSKDFKTHKNYVP